MKITEAIIELNAEKYQTLRRNENKKAQCIYISVFRKKRTVLPGQLQGQCNLSLV